ncbi:MAG: small multi-drug export protein [Candidatus Marinimicrobia bacterium]|nr:small multi-drug export protein [Candidatus Neomarinimicrobiota bacterium]
MGIIEISIIVVICEFILIAVVEFLFTWSLDRFNWTRALKERSERFQEKLKTGAWSAQLIQLGWLGPLIITAIPFSGGVWTGMALARVMVLSTRKTIWAVGIGAVLGCSIYTLAALGFVSIVEIPSD